MNKAIKIISSFLILIILISGCKSVQQIHKDEIIGKYQWHGTYGIASNITLKKDNTFTYHWQTGLIWGTTNGNWELSENKLILISDKQPVEEEDFKIRERDKTQNNQFEIKIIEEREKYELNTASCMLMKDTTFLKGKSTDANGNCILPFDENSNTLQFRHIGFRPVEIQIDQLTSNSFILELKLEKNYYRYFTNRKWTIKKGRIYDPEIKKGKYVKKNYYEKIKGK